jgi:hypothetical protein
MYPITDLARDRIGDLQRTADEIRQERELHASRSAEPVTHHAHAVVRGSPTTACASPSRAERAL